LFGAAFLDLDDNYWTKSTTLNYTSVYFQDYDTWDLYPTLPLNHTIEDGSKAVKIL